MKFLIIFLFLFGCADDPEYPDGNNVPPSTEAYEVATYTVGGLVDGLSGIIVLQNNSTDSKMIELDGVFTFPTVLYSGDSYGVTVAAQPSDETCLVFDATGVINNVNITNVDVSCD